MQLIAFFLWLILLTATLAIPHATHSPTLGDDLTRYTVRLSLLYYAAAAGLMLTLRKEDWLSARGQLARLLWTLAWLAYLVHLGMAFEHYHHWSHADAVEHTRQVSGVGAGIYVSHLFTLVWSSDVLFWWLWPTRHADRSVWIDRLLHGFMAFMFFNATVVFETGLIRVAGVVVFLALGGILAYRSIRWWSQFERG
jgi:hypothetical protein